MSAILEQIKTAYEDSGMSPEEISEDQNLDAAAVKAALMQCSSKYRKACGLEEDNTNGLDFTNDELRRVNEVIFQTAMCAEHIDGSTDWKTRLAAAQYIRDDKKGRKEVHKQMSGMNFNILEFNVQLQKAKELKRAFEPKMIEA